MSGKDHDTRAHPKRRNKINEQWASYPIAMLESPAYRVLSQGAHRVIARIAIELASHGGNDNGQLPVTKEQFEEYGVHHNAIAPALREAEALGFIETTERGRGGNAEMRRPSFYRVTFLHERNSRAHGPTHEWSKIKTMEDAERIAAEGRKAKSQNSVNNGRASWRKRQAKKNFPVPESGTEAGTGIRYRNGKFPGTGFRYYRVSP
jgi:DNA-binding PadR family transcriptional regulator